MYKFFIIILLFPNSIFGQFYDISQIDQRLPDQSNSSRTIPLSFDILTNKSTSLSERIDFKKTLQLFQQKRYFSFIKESKNFQKKYPFHSFTNQLIWLQAHSYLQLKDTQQAQEMLINLTNSSDLDIAHRALLDLYQIHYQDKQLNQALLILQEIQKADIHAPFKEIAHMKYIYTLLIVQNYKQANIFLTSFEQLYPNSPYLEELQYFIALHDIKQGDVKKAKAYALSILNIRTNTSIQRLLGEIELQEKNYIKALEYFLPLSKFPNKYQEEGLYKSALLYKYLKQYSEAHKLLSYLLKYHQSTTYYDRALEELANINIILKNYDDALIYFLKESKYTGARSALALLKITEINFLKTNTLATRRTADRIQKIFPYSSFANEALYWVGRSYILDEEYQKSIDIFDTYLIREPQNVKKDEIMIFLAHAYANLNNQPKARLYFQEIVNSSKNEHLKRQALLGLGRSYNINEPKRSLEYFDRIWKAWPKATDSDKALYYSAAIRYNLKENKEALRLFNNLVTNFPNSIFYESALLAIAKLEFKAENFSNILEISDIILTEKNKEEVSEFKELQARSLFRIQQYEQALLLFQEALKLTKNKIRKNDLFLAEASTLRALGRHEEAVKNYEQYINAFSISNDITDIEDLLWAEIAFSYLELQNTSKAEQTIEYMVKNFPQSSYITDLYYKLADEYFAKNNFTKSSFYYNKARLSTSNSSTIADILLRESWSLYNNKDPQTKDTLQFFLKNYPNHFGVADIMSKLAELEDKDNSIYSQQLYTDIINKYPDSSEAENAREYFNSKLSSTNTFDEFYTALSKTKDKSLKAKYLFKLGNKMSKENMQDEAIQIFKDIHTLRDSKLGADSLFLAANILSTQQKYKDALQLYINIIANYDEYYYSKSLDKIIQIYILLEEYEKAEKFKERLLEQFPNSKESQYWIKQ